MNSRPTNNPTAARANQNNNLSDDYENSENNPNSHYVTALQAMEAAHKVREDVSVLGTNMKKQTSTISNSFGQQRSMLRRMSKCIEEMSTKDQTSEVQSIIDDKVAEAHSQLDNKVAEAHFQLGNKVAEANSELHNKLDRARHDINRAITRIEDLEAKREKRQQLEEARQDKREQMLLTLVAIILLVSALSTYARHWAQPFIATRF